MHCSGDGVADDLDDGVTDDADDDDNQDLEIFMPVARAGICQVVGTSSRSVSVSDRYNQCHYCHHHCHHHHCSTIVMFIKHSSSSPP